MRVSAKVDYALRATLELAAVDGLVKSERIATAQAIPQKFLENILLELRRAELVSSQRGVDGGYALGRPADEISVADVIRAVEGPIATVRGVRPDELEYGGAATGLGQVWLDLRTATRDVLEGTTLGLTLVAEITDEPFPERHRADAGSACRRAPRREQSTTCPRRGRLRRRVGLTRRRAPCPRTPTRSDCARAREARAARG